MVSHFNLEDLNIIYMIGMGNLFSTRDHLDTYSIILRPYKTINLKISLQQCINTYIVSKKCHPAPHFLFSRQFANTLYKAPRKPLLKEVICLGNYMILPSPLVFPIKYSFPLRKKIEACYRFIQFQALPRVALTGSDQMTLQTLYGPQTG